jgi:hypothetical protein
VAALEFRVITGSMNLYPVVDSEFAIRFGIEQPSPWIHFERPVRSEFCWRFEQLPRGKFDLRSRDSKRWHARCYRVHVVLGGDALVKKLWPEEFKLFLIGRAISTGVMR